MRTLKKVLALTVVLATLLSISAFAAFSDEESIDENFVEAVNLLGALNVMTGDKEGTFRPNDTIMRAEAAKMIYVIRNGGVDDLAAGWTGMTTFSDVPAGAWYEGYVNYCASLGIIAGVGNGKFNPNGAVTGVELAKMLLVVADYKPEIEGYTGAGWNLNVIRDAQTAGMFKGYTLAYSASATRQQAAQLFSNAILETQMAVYIGDTRVNDLAMITNTGTIGGRYFGLFTVTGILTKVQHVDLPLNFDINGNTTQAGNASNLNSNDELSEVFVTARDADGAMLGATTFEFAADPDLLYQEVDVIFREDTDDPGVLSRDAKVYAVLSTGNTYVYDTTMDAITIDLKDNSKDVSYVQGADYNPLTIQFEGYNGGRAKTLPFGFTLPVVTNLYEAASFQNGFVNDDVMVNIGTYQADWDRDLWILNEHDIEMVATTSTAPIRLIDYNRDGELDIAFVTTPYYGTVSSYNADRYEFTTDAEVDGDNITTGRRQAEFENFTFEDELEKDDVIALTLDVTSGEMLYNVALVEPTVGTLTYVYSTGLDNEVVIGGETYGFYGLLFDGEYLVDMDPVLEAESYLNDLGTEVTVYTDGKYIISAEVEPATLGSGFAFVKDYNLEGNSFNPMLSDSRALLLELVLPDGTTVVKEYDRDEVTSATAGWYEERDLVNLTDRTATDLLEEMVGNIVEYSADGDYVAFRSAHKSDNLTPAEFAELDPEYHNDDPLTYEYNSDTNVFRADGNRGLDVNENSVFFLPTYDDDAAGDVAGNITKVAVIKGSALRGQPEVTTEANTTDMIMQLVSCKQSGINTIAYAALDAGTSISETGLYFYALQNDWEQDVEDGDGRYALGVLSDSGSDEGQIIEINAGDDVVANKLYRATRNSDGTYDIEEIDEGVAPSANEPAMNLGSISGRNGNNVDINGDVFHYVPNETVVFVIDVDARGSMTRINLGDLSDLTKAAEDDHDNPYNNIMFEADNENALTVVYVEAVGMDMETVISYTEQGTLTIAALPELPVGVNKSEAEEAIKAALPNSVRVAGIQWFVDNNPVADDGDFTVAYGSTYKAVLTLTAAPGRPFPAEGEEVELKIGNVTVDPAPVVNEDGEITVTLGGDETPLVVAKNQITTADQKADLKLADVNAIDSDPNTDDVDLVAGEIDNVSNIADLKDADDDVEVITWYDGSDNELDDVPAAGSTVVAKFTLKAAENYIFADDFTVTVKDATNVTVTLNADKDEANVVAVFKKADPIVISGSSLIEADDLKHDAELDDGIEEGELDVDGGISASLTVKSLTWSSEKAVYGETLTAQIKLDGTTSLAGLTTNDFTAPTGYVVKEVETVGVDGTSVIVTLEAPAVAKAKVDAVVLTGLTAPEKGQALPTPSVAANAGVKIASFQWHDGEKNVAAGTSAEAETYTLTITFTAQEGYVIDTTGLGPTVTGTGGGSVAFGDTLTAESVTVVVFYLGTGA